MRIVAVAVLFAVSALAQAQPNFTGTWKRAGSPEVQFVMKIDQRNATLKVDTEMRETPRPTTLQRPTASMSSNEMYNADGVERTWTLNDGSQRWRSIYYEGPVLVFMTVSKQNYRVTVTRETWSLSQDGYTLTVAKRVVDMDGVKESKRVFERQ